MELVITQQGFDYMVELKTGMRGVYFDPPVKQLFGGVNPDDSRTWGGYHPHEIIHAARLWAIDQEVYDNKPLKVKIVKEGEHASK